MLEDLRLVRNNEPPRYARRQVDLDSLARIEETGKTVDLVPNPATPQPGVNWNSPQLMMLYWVAGGSIFVNLILVILLIILHK